MADVKETSGIKQIGKAATFGQIAVSIEGVGKTAGATIQHQLNKNPAAIVDSSGNRVQVTFDKLREIRRDPTISLAREMRAAMILSAEWGIELADDADEKQKILLEKTLLPLRTEFLRTATYGEIDFGWRAYEKLFKLADIEGIGQIVTIDRLKPLLNDNTFQRQDAEGNFIGLLHKDVQTGVDIYIDEAHSLFVNFDDDGVGNYNDPGLIRCIESYEGWRTANTVARRYDNKVAGATWVIHYPIGSTRREGVRVDNYTIAQEIMATLKATGHIIVPNGLFNEDEDALGELGQRGWKFEIVEAGAHQAEFITRLKYYDVLKARGLFILERSIFEGQFGTKAEAGVHGDITLTIQDLRHQELTNIFNKDVVNQLTAYNFDSIDTVKFVAKPMTDDRKELFQTLLTQLMSNPNFGAEVISSVNVDEVFRILQIPQLNEKEKAEQNTISSMFQKIGERMGGAPNNEPQKDSPKTNNTDKEGLTLSKFVQGFSLSATPISQGSQIKPPRKANPGRRTIEIGSNSFSVEINPTKARAKYLLKNLQKPRGEAAYVPKNGALRGVVDIKTGNTYFWDGINGTHHRVANAIGIDVSQEDYFYVESDAAEKLFESEWYKLQLAAMQSLRLGPYEEIEGLAYNANEDDDECGAGSPGGQGFEKGNTCGKRGNKFATNQKTLLDKADLERIAYHKLPLRKGYEEIAKPAIEKLLAEYEGEEIGTDGEIDVNAALDDEAWSDAESSYLDSNYSEFHNEAYDQIKTELEDGIRDMYDNDTDFAVNELESWLDHNADSGENPDGVTLENLQDIVDPVDGEIDFVQVTWSDDDEFIELKSREAGLPEGKLLNSGEMAKYNEERFVSFYGEPSDFKANYEITKEEVITSYIDEQMEEKVDEINDAAIEASSEAWANLSVEEKFEYLDSDSQELMRGGGVITIPDVWSPITSSSKGQWKGANEEDYNETRKILRLIQKSRSVDLITERHIESAKNGVPILNVRKDASEEEIRDAAEQLTRDLDGKVWSAWKSSSVSDFGKAIQLASVDEFGAQGKKAYEDSRQDIINAVKGRQYEGLKAYLRATWEGSQYALEQAGVDDTMTTWRAIERPAEEIERTTKWHVRTGVNRTGDSFIPVGKTPNDTIEYTTAPEYHVQLPDLKLLRNGAQSSSAFSDTPNSWQGVGYNEYFPDGSHKKERVVLRVENNREDILSVPAYGQNIHSEQEVITLGTPWRGWEAWLNKAPSKTHKELEIE